MHFVFAQIALARTSTGRLTAREDEKFRLFFVAGEKEKYNGVSVIESVEDLFPENSVSSLVHRWYLSIYHQSIYLASI